MSDAPDAADVTLAVLAGGAGSRMGQPKGALRVHGRPILVYLLDRFAWPGPTLLVTAPGRDRPPGADRFSREVVDPAAGLGPLRGVLTALEHLTTPLLVVTPVDMPLVRPAQFRWLADRLMARRDLLGMMVRRDAGRLEPLPCALRAPALPVVRDHLAAGRRSLHSLVTTTRATGIVAAPAPGDWPAETWTNVNDPDEWAAFLAMERSPG